MNEDYIFYYVNIGQNVVTGLIPLVSLVTLNYLVYKHLKERRKGIFALGNILMALFKVISSVFKHMYAYPRVMFIKSSTRCTASGGQSQ